MPILLLAINSRGFFYLNSCHAALHMMEVFSYFEGDATNLPNFRLVCRASSSAVVPAVRRSLIWKIGTHPLSEDNEEEKWVKVKLVR